MDVHVGETWGKRQKSGAVSLYLVLRCDARGNLRLQNLASPASVFDTRADKFLAAGYFLVSQTPYIDLERRSRRKSAGLKPQRCPRTLDFIEGRADAQKPDPGAPRQTGRLAETD